MSLLSIYKTPLISPSLLAADKKRFHEEISLALSSGASLLHFDVMDGSFVPATSFSIDDMSALLSVFPALALDVHLMVSDPLTWGPLFGRLGAKNVTFHLEALPSKEKVFETISAIRETGASVGMSIKPKTPPESVLPYLKYLDLLLLMSVEPGKGGQAFLSESVKRMETLCKYRKEGAYHDLLLEVDGGINEKTAPLMLEAGADILVAGSYLFGHDDFAARMARLLK